MVVIYSDNGEWYAYSSTGKSTIGNSFGRQGLVIGSKLIDVGIEEGFALKASYGFQKVNDNVISGSDIAIASVRLGELKGTSSWSLEKGYTKSTKANGWTTKGKMLIDTGAQYEGVLVGELPMDFKAKYTQALDPNTGSLTPYEISAGIGAPFVEAKLSHNFDTNQTIYKTGFQEDGTVMKIPFGPKGILGASEIVIKWDINLQAFVSITDL